MRTARSLIISILLLFLAVSSLSAEPLRVGVIAGFTGSWASYGYAIRNGLELSQKDLPEPALKFFYEDDQFTPRLSITAARKLVEVDKVQVLIVGDSTTAKAVVAEAVRANVPLMAWSTEDSAFNNQPLVFRTWTTLSKEIALLKEEVKKQKYQSIAIWSGPHVYTNGFSREAKKSLQDLVKDYQEFDQDLSDYRPYLLKLREKKIEALGVCLNAGQHAVLLKQLYALHFPLKLFGCNMLNYVSDIEALRSYHMTAWVFDSNLTSEFRKKYIEATQSEEMLSTGAIFFDTGLILTRASKLRTDKNIALQEAIGATGEFNGANGRFSVVVTPEQRYFDFVLHKLDLP